MRSPRQERPCAPGGGEHSFFAFDDDRAWARTVLRHVREGLETGQRVLYAADGDDCEVVLDVLRSGGIDVGAGPARGRLSVTTAADSYLGELPVDPDRVIAVLRSLCTQALDDGHTGLRALGEMSWCARESPSAERLLEYELRLDREVYADLPLSGLCLFDRRTVPARTIELLGSAHPAHPARPRRPAPDGDHPPGDSVALSVAPLRGQAGLRLTGSGDRDTQPVLHAALAAASRMPDPAVHLDLSGVTYLGIDAVADLVAVTSTLHGQGRRLLLHNPPYSLRRVAEMFPDECAALEVAA